jgi:hypothetical protein
MAVRELHVATESFISGMQLNDDDKIQVENCISRYSTPDSFCGFLNYLAYLVENTFRSILGTSDWQMAINVIHTNALEKAKEQNLFLENPQNRVDQHINQRVSTTLRNWAAEILNIALTTENYQPHPSDVLQHAINEFALTQFLQTQASTVETIRQRITAQSSSNV